ncbi:hypothetical protein [Cellulomonas fimi]|uniref:Uncharacterized protein n=1 Tax=Cellulomonas fimi TaxID=1708 RepID=A0A7Y0LYF7_CELFI|nr:hypothetical protein [Cellulomonas fimi]NMR20211.1 hypothetical protein [Cellulomonas fimi]
MQSNTTENVFRFMQLRPVAPVELDPSGAGGVDLVESRLLHALVDARPDERTAIAHEFLAQDERGQAVLDSTDTRRVVALARDVLCRGGTTADLVAALAREISASETSASEISASDGAAVEGGWPGAASERFADALDALSDAVLARRVRGGAKDRGRFERLLRLHALVVDGGRRTDQRLRSYLHAPVRLPAALRDVVGQPARGLGARRARGDQDADGAVGQGAGDAVAQGSAPRLWGRAPDLSAATRVQQAVAELAGYARPGLLVVPGVDVRPTDADDMAEASADAHADPERPRRVPYSLVPDAVARLSQPTLQLLADLELDPTAHPLEVVVDRLTAELERRVRLGLRPAPLPPPPDVDDDERPYLRDVGVADLLVVKQHLKRYQRMDVAHVENVLAGETRSRNHRALERIEETFTTERETTTERQTELETADRFELNREASRTVKRDQEFGFGLSLSGRYGPSVEFSSEVRASSSTSTEDSTTSAQTYARDVIERSLERVIERVREEQVRRITREREEVNLHELTNTTTEHVSGVYQFIEKVYESQVFNYGIRQMFDFMVPEPSSYVWHLERSTAELALPTPPIPLETRAPDATAIDEVSYRPLAALYGAEGITTPPPVFVTASSTVMHGEGADDEGEEGQPRSTLTPDLAIPAGYRPYRATVQLMALTDDLLTVAVTVGRSQRVWRPGSTTTDVGSDHSIGRVSLDMGLLTSDAYEGQSKLPVHLLAYETNTYSASVDAVFTRTLEHYEAWQLSTYDKLVDAYQRKVQVYDSQVAEIQAKADAEAQRSSSRFVAPPTQNLQTVRDELKKHCISIVTRQRYGQFQATQDTDPPYFDFTDAEDEGSFIRFFEQAFEWDQLQYVCYPYYWGRRSTWAERFLRQDADPAWLEFLRSGAARVVVPARPGFEAAIAYYLETGKIWRGGEVDPDDPLGGLPDIDDPLYVSILTEIMERTGAPQGEIPVGEPWLTHVPTPLVVLRPDDDLPRWKRVDPDGWEWDEDE